MEKYVEEHTFQFDKSYDENVSNQTVFQNSVLGLIDFAFQGGKVSCFAYGQTGSGKTYTMIGNQKTPGIYVLAANQMFNMVRSSQENLQIKFSYFEIYCGKLFDLLNARSEIIPREDKKGDIQLMGLQKIEGHSTQQVFDIVSQGNSLRVTSSTGKNEESSRSHAILQFSIERNGKDIGQLSFIDLAGNERGGDTYGHNQQT